MKWSYYLGKDISVSSGKMYDTRLSNDLYLRFSVNHCPLNPDSVHMIPENGMKIIGFHDPVGMILAISMTNNSVGFFSWSLKFIKELSFGEKIQLIY